MTMVERDVGDWWVVFKIGCLEDCNTWLQRPFLQQEKEAAGCIFYQARRRAGGALASQSMDIVLFTEDMDNHIDSRTFVSKFFFFVAKILPIALTAPLSVRTMGACNKSGQTCCTKIVKRFDQGALSLMG